MNTQLYVGVGILTVQGVSHATITVQPVLLRYISGLAQSLFLTTPIWLTAGVASLLIGFTCFFFLGGTGWAAVGVGDMVYALLHRSGFWLGELWIFKNLLRSDGGTAVLIHQTFCSNKFSHVLFTTWVFLIGFDSFPIHQSIFYTAHWAITKLLLRFQVWRYINNST